MHPSAPPLQPPPAGGVPLLPPALPPSTGFHQPPGTSNSVLPHLIPPGFHFPPPTTATTTEASDIPTALSALTSLLRLSQNSLNSLSGILPTASPSLTALIPCPFNPTHRLPPPSLFNHSLHCIPSSSSSSSAELDSLIMSCSYPHNIQSSAEGNHFLFNQSLKDPEAELCFSLESYSGFDRNGFLYSDCPGVVSFPLKDPSPPMLTLPSFLLSQCSNIIRNSDVDPKEFPGGCTELLPSEIYSIRVEVESWNDYPCSYSYRVLRAMLRLEMSRICSLLTWVIANSPKFGIVIDSAMSSHIVLLFKLCLKAISSEAIGLANAHLKLGGDKESVSSEYRVDCPILARVLMWLASQLSILYGETSGRLFAINILRQYILDDALKDSLFTGLQQATQLPKFKDVDTVSEEPQISSKPSEIRKENEGNGVESGTHSKCISVSQVAAAVAALHERSMLEGKIRSLQNVRQLSAPQRNAEHEYIKKSADEERQKRSSYKALMDHDGLPWQRTHNQETNKMKTREELLAEERDYKRRRMSYRGKKLKRSITQVMRDVIEEYMEIINGTGGVDNLTKEEETHSGAKSDKSQLESSLTQEHAHQHTKDSYSLREARSSDLRDRSSKEKTQDRCNYSHSTVEADRSAGRNGRSRVDCSRSPDRSNTYTNKHTSLRRRQGDQEAREEDIYHSSSRKHLKSYDKRIHKERVDQRRRREREAYNDRTSVSTLHNKFDYRYDPSESRDDLRRPYQPVMVC